MTAHSSGSRTSWDDEVDVDVGGFKMHARVSGSSPYAVLIHRFGADSGAWVEVVRQLPPGAGACAIDLPGHGASDVPANGVWNGDLLADAVATVVEQICPDPLLFVGHSVGAGVVVRVILATGNRYSGMLICPSIDGYPFRSDHGFRLKLVFKAAETPDPAARFLYQWQLAHALLEPLATRASWGPLQELIASVGGDFVLPNADSLPWCRLEELSDRVGILAASDDGADYVEQAAVAAARLGTEVKWIEGGHDLVSTKPADVARAIGIVCSSPGFPTPRSHTYQPARDTRCRFPTR